MHPSNPSMRRRRDSRLAAEPLESRELMTGGAGDTFAVIPGTVLKSGHSAEIKVTIDPSNFTLPHGKMALGIDVIPVSGSSVKPKIVSVVNSNGHAIPELFHSHYNPRESNITPGIGKGTSTVVTPIHLSRNHLTESQTYTVNIRGVQGSTGQFLVGFYLPGDVNGDGTVDKSDVKALKASYRSDVGDNDYNFNADANRDGRIGQADLSLTKRNLGVSTTVTPAASVNLDTSSAVAPNTRVFNLPFARFTGSLTPGAVVKFTETSGKSQPVATVADASGNYSILVPLVSGDNTFTVSTLDSFGQGQSTTLAPVTYVPK